MSRSRVSVAGVEKTLRVLPLGLLALSLAFSLALLGVVIRRSDLVAILSLTTLLAAVRVWLAVAPPPVAVRRVVFWASFPVVTVLIVLSPFYGLYAFLGYLEGSVLFRRGPATWAGLALTAALCALSQMGGPRSGLASVPVYLLFLAANLLIAGLMERLDRRRERTTIELERLVTELRRSEERNAELREQLIVQAREAGVLDERTRLSREIHDTVAQSLVGIITQLEAAENTDDASERVRRSERARAAAREALDEARRAVHALASPRLDGQPLAGALRTLVDQVSADGGPEAGFVLDGEAAATEADGELLRVGQEALSNVVRHARATHVQVTLGYSPGEVRLDIFDDGCGFDPATAGRGRGLPGMRERLARLGGALEIETSEGGGCAVSAAVPR